MATPAAAARPAWSGSITFGLVAVPVRLYPATESHVGPELHQVHKIDGSRVRLRRWCEAENREIDYGDVAKGWDAPDGGVVVLTEEDLASLPVPSKRIIDVLAFVPAGQISPLLFDTPYFVGLAEKAPAKPYLLLRDVMRDSGLVAVTKVTLRERESLAVLRVLDDVLMLQTIRWPDEVRPTEGIKVPTADEPVHKNEVKMVLQLAEAMSDSYELDAERDAYIVAMQELLAAKAGGGQVEHAAEAPERAAPPMDIMAALRASIAETQAQRETTPAPASAKKPAAKKTPRRTAPKRAS
ncbi:non-homologous end joining protein Ku [Streptacidiphilus anmyonensis]|uniref:non-homologous end joining protein Ku n=1 Tax=Streptacidiphilus anmyonensis TaxID=405782 RepID=UPI0005A8DFCD|nr:Ku protein [Streptacidiphilus anmyonensis]